MSKQQRYSKGTSKGPSLGLFAGKQQRASTANTTTTRKKRKKKKKTTQERPTTATQLSTASSSAVRSESGANMMTSSIIGKPSADRILRRKRRPLPITEDEPGEKGNIINESKYSTTTATTTASTVSTSSSTSKKGYVGRKQRRRGLDAVISATREYVKRPNTNKTTINATIPGISMQEAARRSANEAATRALRASSRAPHRPSQGVPHANSATGGVRLNRNLIQHSNAVFMGHGLSNTGNGLTNSMGDNTTDRIMRARVRSIRKETPEIDDEEEEKRHQKEETERKRLYFENQKRKEAEMEAAQFLAAIAAEEEEKRLFEIEQLKKLKQQQEEERLEKIAEEAAAANYAAAVSAAIAAENAAHQKLCAEHREIQQKYRQMNDPERPQTSPGRMIPPELEGDFEELRELTQRVNRGEQDRIQNRSRSRAEPGYNMPETLDRSPIKLPFHLDPVAKAVAEEMKRREEDEKRAQKKMDEEAAARAKEDAAKKAAAGFFKSTGEFDDAEDEEMKQGQGKGQQRKDNNNEKQDELKAKRKKRRNNGLQDNEGINPDGDVDEEGGEGNGTKEKEEDVSDAPLLRVYRRARPHLPGIRPMVSPQDAANALVFSSAMFHRDPTTRRVRWDGSLPLPPDAETCCRRGMTLLRENDVQGSIFWFSIGYGQEADTYADGTQQLPEEGSDLSQDKYFCVQEIPETVVRVEHPRTGFEHGVLSILARGIAYSRLGCWSQALWDFSEADSMSQNKCREAKYFRALAHESRQEIKKALDIVLDILSNEPVQDMVILHDLDDGNNTYSSTYSDSDDSDDSDDSNQRKKHTNTKSISYDDVFYSHVLTLKAACLADLGRYTFALTAYDDAITRDAANTYALWSRTRLLLDPNVTVESDFLHEESNSPNQIELALRKEMRRKRAVLKDLTRLVSLDPGRVEYLEDAVDMFVDLAEYQEGLSVVQVLVEIWEKGGVGQGNPNVGNFNNIGASSDQLPSHGFEREIFLTFFPDRQSSDVGKRQLATAYCLRARLRSFLLLGSGNKKIASPVSSPTFKSKSKPKKHGYQVSNITMQAVMEDLKRAEELDATLPHTFLYRGALKHPARLLKSARLNNKHDHVIKTKTAPAPPSTTATGTATATEIHTETQKPSKKKINFFNTAREVNKEKDRTLSMASMSSTTANDDANVTESNETGGNNNGDDDSAYYPPSFFDDVGGHHVIADLSTAVDLLPSSVDALILRASMYIRVGMFSPALHDLREAAYLQPNSMEVWLLIARIYLQHFHDYDSAIHATTFAIQLDPKQNAAYYVRAEAHLRGGEIDVALADYGRILRNDPSEPWPWLFQGHILAARGRARLAMYSSIAFLRATGEKTSKEIAASIKAKKAEADALKTKQSFRKLWKSHDHTDEATVTKHIIPRHVTRLDQANGLLDDFNRAATQYRKAAMRNPTVHTFCRLADALVHLGDVTEALNILHRALEMNEDSPEVHATLGRCYLSIEDYDRALESFDTSIYLNPKDPILYNERGVCKTLQEQTHLIHIRDLKVQQARTGGFEPLKEDFIKHNRSSDEGEFDDDGGDEDLDYFENHNDNNNATKSANKKKRRKKKVRKKKKKNIANNGSKSSRMNKRKKGKGKGKGGRKKRSKSSNRKRKQRVAARIQLLKRMEKNKKEKYIPKTKEQLENIVGMSGLSDINQCLEIDPTNTDALLNRAELFARAGQDKFASEDFKTVLNLDPENVRCYINRGVHRVKKNRAANAISDFDHALKNDPANPLALYNRAVAYTDARQYDQAIQDYTICLESVPEAVAALRNRGLLHLWNGNAQKAKNDLSQVLELVQDTPEESESHDLLPALGHCEAQLGLLVPNALDAVNHAMHHRGGVLIDALVSRGSVFYSLASAGYEYAPSSTFGSIAHRLQTHDEMIGKSTISKLESEPGRASLNARSKSHSQWSELSISDFSKALRLDPSATTIRANLAEALSASADSLQRNINEQEKETVKAWKQRKRQRTKLALQHFSAVLSMDPDHAGALNGRGVVYLRLGQLEEAYGDLTMALEKIEEGQKEKRTLTEIIRTKLAMNKADATANATATGTSGSKKLQATGRHLSQENQIAETLLKRKGLNAAKQRCRCLVDRAMILVRAGSSKQAELDLTEAVNLGKLHNFETPSAMHDLGTLKVRSGKYKVAIHLLNQTINIKGQHIALAKMTRGVALCSSTPPLFKEAMKDFDAVVETYPSNVHGLYNRAVCQAMLGNLRLAEEDLNRAIAMNPGDAMLYDQRGKNFAAMGRPRMAMKDMATSLLL